MQIIEFPEFRQTFDYDCGAKTMHAMLAYYGIDVNEIDLIKIADTNDHHGTPLAGLEKIAQHFGLKYHAKKMTIDDLKKYIDRQQPVILMLQAWPKRKVHNWSKHWSSGHFAIAIGYDQKKIYFEDPAVTIKTYLEFSELMKRWHDVDTHSDKKYYNLGIVISGKQKVYSAKRITHMD
ncbi:C39 family peptidase [Candidatus Nomurabacteria bacterium]|nr:C39 family peptidase [Candidatus Nomurabacteria bacterium]